MQPYKPKFSANNVVDSVLILVMALWCATIVCTNVAELKAIHTQKECCLSSVLYILYWMCSQREFGQRMIGRVHGWIAENHRQMVFTGSVESLPNRLTNSEEYDEDFTDQVAVQVKKHE